MLQSGAVWGQVSSSKSDQEWYGMQIHANSMVNFHATYKFGKLCSFIVTGGDTPQVEWGEVSKPATPAYNRGKRWRLLCDPLRAMEELGKHVTPLEDIWCHTYGCPCYPLRLGRNL